MLTVFLVVMKCFKTLKVDSVIALAAIGQASREQFSVSQSFRERKRERERGRARNDALTELTLHVPV